MKRKESLRERFIKNKRLLNPTHIFPKKEKQPETRITKRIVLMSRSNDDEEETLWKRQIRQEDIVMRGKY